MSAREKGLFIGSFFLFFFLISTRIFLEGQFYCNDQFGFGFFPMTEWFLGVEILLLVSILYLIGKTKILSEKVVLSILFVGGFSNVYERIFFGCVLDYLKLPFIGSFINIADILITAVLVYLAIITCRGGFKK